MIFKVVGFGSDFNELHLHVSPYMSVTVATDAIVVLTRILRQALLGLYK